MSGISFDRNTIKKNLKKEKKQKNEPEYQKKNKCKTVGNPWR